MLIDYINVAVIVILIIFIVSPAGLRGAEVHLIHAYYYSYEYEHGYQCYHQYHKYHDHYHYHYHYYYQ